MKTGNVGIIIRHCRTTIISLYYRNDLKGKDPLELLLGKFYLYLPIYLFEITEGKVDTNLCVRSVCVARVSSGTFVGFDHLDVIGPC